MRNTKFRGAVALIASALLLLFLIILSLTVWKDSVPVQAFLGMNPFYKALLNVLLVAVFIAVMTAVGSRFVYAQDKAYHQAVTAIIHELPAETSWHISCKSQEQFRSLDPEPYWETLMTNRAFMERVRAQYRALADCMRKLAELDSTDVSQAQLSHSGQLFQAALRHHNRIRLTWTYKTPGILVPNEKAVTRPIREFIDLIGEVPDLDGQLIPAQYFLSIYRESAIEDEPGCYVIFSCKQDTPASRAEQEYVDIYIGQSEAVWSHLYHTVCSGEDHGIDADFRAGNAVYIRVEPCDTDSLTERRQALMKKYMQTD